MLLAMMPLCSFAFVIKEGESEVTCDNASEWYKELSTTTLEKAYALKYIVSCTGRSRLERISSEEWFTSDFFIQNKKELNRLISVAEFSQEDVELIFWFVGKFYLTPKSNELVRKAFLVELDKHQDFYGTDGDHPYQPHIMTFDHYTRIASKYYSNGMYDEGKRVLNELRELPYQDTLKIDKKIANYEIAYKTATKSEFKEATALTSETIEEKKSGLNEVAELDKNTKPVPEGIKQEKQVDPAPAVTQLESIFKQYGIFIFAFLIFFGMYLYSRRKTKK